MKKVYLLISNELKQNKNNENTNFIFFLLTSLQIQSQTTDSIEYKKMTSNIESIVQKADSWKFWRKKKYAIEEEFKGVIFTKKEILKRRKLKKIRLINKDDNGMQLNIVEILLANGELIFAKEYYTEDKEYYKEYYFHNGEYFSTRTVRGVRLLVDDVGKEYLDWIENKK